MIISLEKKKTARRKVDLGRVVSVELVCPKAAALHRTK